MTIACGQQERDAEILRKHAERYAVIALAGLPSDYESRKRIVTNAILSALKTATPIDEQDDAKEILLDHVAEFFDQDAPVHPGSLVTYEGQEITAARLLERIRLGK